ncbi:hypothetical protein BDF20DRAFT_950608 [Mycotypha africana]|uniref:uncharacterized protein n=1 Tax=Mycotypha africana TaxID=64632 RepID=UPI00230122D8|nr:uncharacterized protein BDF20DRAFT_950608 [Mycotypha africana]KAI8991670.1 hypothetical protein BDF20DRAFT_950608 [Mycotypha africana]
MPSREAKRHLKRKLERKKREIAEEICKDCGEVGHINKKSYKCQLYDASKKRKAGAKDDYETKAAKARGKKKKLEDSKKRAEQDVVCSSCGKAGHSRSSSPLCLNYKPPKDVLLRRLFEDGHEVYSRKLLLTTLMRPAFAQVATENIIKLAEFTRQVVYRAQLFVNYYITDNYETTTGHPYLYEQNFWYSICKLILGKRVRNRQYMDMSVTLAFDDFKSKFPTIVYSLKTHPMKGYSDSLAAACVTLATTYSNFIVENFENRLKHYARTCLKHLFPVSHDRIHNNCSSRVSHEVLFILCSRNIRKEKSTESSTNTASKR